MQSAIFAAALAFLILLVALTVSVTAEHGFTALTFISLVVLALLGIGVLGALMNHPPDD
jgi:hypothetical protein